MFQCRCGEIRELSLGCVLPLVEPLVKQQIPAPDVIRVPIAACKACKNPELPSDLIPSPATIPARLEGRISSVRENEDGMYGTVVCLIGVVSISLSDVVFGGLLHVGQDASFHLSYFVNARFKKFEYNAIRAILGAMLPHPGDGIGTKLRRSEQLKLMPSQLEFALLGQRAAFAQGKFEDYAKDNLKDLRPVAGLWCDRRVAHQKHELKRLLADLCSGG